MNTIIKSFIENDKFRDYEKNIKNNISPITILGLTDVAKVINIVSTNEVTKRRVCLITYNELQAKKMVEDLKCFNSNIVYFPKREIVTYDYVVESKDLPYERIDTLNKLYDNSVDIVVTTVEACMQKMIMPNDLYKNVVEVEFATELKFEEFKEKLVKLGYVRTEIIETRGQFSVRGNIVDVGISNNKAVRIEFWGDNVDSIRYFNIDTQRSIDEINKIKIYPAHEFLLNTSLEKIIDNIKNNEYDKYDIDKEKNSIFNINQDNYISKIDKFFNYFYNNSVNFFSFLPQDMILFLDENNKIKSRVDNINKDNEILIKSLIEKEKIVPQVLEELLTYDKISEEIEKRQCVYLEKQDIINRSSNIYRYTTNELNFYKSSLESLVNKTIESASNNKKVAILCGNEINCKKVISILVEKDVPHRYIDSLSKNLDTGIVSVSKGKLSSGVEICDNNLVIISSEELFTETKRKKTGTTFNQSEKIVFGDLKVGDYVVHKSVGIGQFIGVNTIKVDNIIKDYIKIKYKDGDILYVPTNSLDSVRKFIGGGEAEPKLNKIGSKDWENTKSRVKSNLREVAKELIELYARRKKARGFMFSLDTVWQKEFEDSFPYTETDDQLRCIEEVKKDMEHEMPMDRLLCGDVGYGKTEVAIRAAFKAVMDQKQVAYLVPTTVLANQQYEGFKERMKDFPIKVEVLNRFKTKKEQEDIIKKLELGEIDIIIGTHRILSKDVNFKDLGLLIIDEEHRFGVKAKEKIKLMKSTIDVLTMTATPIPRTLHMSILGIRDMSVIYEPPHNRKPVQTYVLEYDDEIIKEAITKEIEKGGQVFYLFNNVEEISNKAQYISELVPEAKVEFAHGQMSGRELERIMEKFVSGKINVLVCTTILESGIDIPNANTIIVENADRLGLAQLYQIRGRVGRSNLQGYAYITYKRDKILSEVADKRLKAIKEFAEFGSGFKIAMRDLEIRGAGSLLGEIQHGHMEQVGYDTYCHLLDEVVKDMQGIHVKEEKNVQIDINVSCYIQDEYIDNISQKIEIYQKIALIKKEEDIEDIIDELTDRFGNIPNELENLFEISRIKMLAAETAVTKINQKGCNVVFTIDSKIFNNDCVDKLISLYKNKVKFSSTVEPQITLSLANTSELNVMKEIKEFLKNIM